VSLEQAQTHNRSALEYWQDELSNKAPETRTNYLRYLKQFLAYTNQDADQLIQERNQNILNPDITIRRKTESQFLKFLSSIKTKYAPMTQQTIYASIRSFFEIHDCPLKIRKSDYPKGQANGVQRATDQAILKILENKPSPKLEALIHTLKDTGLRISDLKQLKCNLILENPNAEIIPITLTTEKTSLIAKTFLGYEAIQALKKYLNFREKEQEK
jgi:integrase